MNLPVEYVLNDMPLWQARAFVKLAHYKNKDEWEQTRMISYVTAQVNSTKSITPRDIIKFPWDEEEVKLIKKEATEEELENLRAKTKIFTDLLNNG